MLLLPFLTVILVSFDELSQIGTFNQRFFAEAVMATPRKFRMVQPDGSLTPELSIVGGPRGHKITDPNGYTVIETPESGAIVYAQLELTSGKLIPSDLLVTNTTNITKLEEKNITLKGLEPTEEAKKVECKKFCTDEDEDDDYKFNVGNLTIHFSGNRKLYRNGKPKFSRWQNSSRHMQRLSMADGTLRNLVILMKFSDHVDRDLPTIRDFDALMNKAGGHVTVAPTGSVRDVYLQSSYGKFDLVSTVVGWVTLPESESYYADGSSGSTSKFEEALSYALDLLDQVPKFSFEKYDKNGDSIIDSVMFVHSGYGAEWGAVDCSGQKYKDRIWSHKWRLKPNWVSSKGNYAVENYFTTSALFDPEVCGMSVHKTIARIGTIAHELGHVLGLPDLYMGGSGIGSHGLMGNSWGFDGSQLYPPQVSPWCKIMLGWVRPLVVRQSGNYILSPSISTPEVIKISKGFPPNEYLLIENRQKKGFDAKLPKSGLIIYHIDEYASFYKNPGYPLQEGWPENGNHYRVALMQPDTLYELERGLNRGDENDVYNAGQSIGPGSVIGPFPNTDAYQDGTIKSTGIRIYDIQENSDGQISFSIDMPGAPPPTTSPTKVVSVPLAKSELGTTFTGELGSYGNMFDIVSGREPIIIFSLDIHLRSNGENKGQSKVKVFTKTGTHIGYENGSKLENWRLICSTVVTPEGFYKRTHIPEESFEPVTVSAKSIQSFYVTVDTPDLRYTRGTRTSDPFASNSDITILQGTGISKFFENSWAPRVFNGFVRYSTILSDRNVTKATSGSEYIPSINENNKLTTTFIDENGSYGNMFNIYAIKAPVTITSLDVHLRSTELTQIEVYTKQDTYRGYEKDTMAWTLICATEVKGNGRGRPTPIPFEAFKSVDIKSGLLQAFFVTVKEKGLLRYSNRLVLGQDDFIEVRDGSGIGTYPFAFGSNGIFYPRGFNGSIKYTVSNSEMLSNVAQKVNTDLLMSTFKAGNGSYGIMFNIIAFEDLKILSFDIHTKAKDEVLVQIFNKDGSYMGFEKNPRSWNKICEVVVVGKGSFQRTHIPSGCFESINMLKGTIMGFYITLPTLDLRYSDEEHKMIGEIDTQSQHMALSVGTGIGSYPLTSESSIHERRLFNGIVEYLPVYESSLSQNLNVLKTPLLGGNRGYGVLFSVKARRDIKIKNINFLTLSSKTCDVEVWTRPGPFSMFTKTMNGWSLVSSAEVKGRGKKELTKIKNNDFAPVEIRHNEIQSFFVALNFPLLLYTNGQNVGDVYVQNSDLIFMEGVGTSLNSLSDTTKIFSPRRFNGALVYE
eukprot:CAMPEP_0184859064 /NCGR_PEP_ID=MMETSP0580-20130426/4093_1 /TAXON_ID=1118495 /ORGANISM="Dactyliosolen fragilissimus" /LENGTH=1298 /DNA_ID=CAMNT_0027355503 /DNA_START=285 /DNA_END=4181 /DNA_ORIENTATION=-